MANFAIVDSGGTVENVVVADRIEDVFPPSGTIVVAADVNAEIGGTYDGTNFTPVPRPPPPPPPEPTATGAQMIDEAKERGQLAALLAVLDVSERAVFYTRRRIIAGSGIAETLRARLGISAVAMASFIAAAAVRVEA